MTGGPSVVDSQPWAPPDRDLLEAADTGFGDHAEHLAVPQVIKCDGRRDSACPSSSHVA